MSLNSTSLDLLANNLSLSLKDGLLILFCALLAGLWVKFLFQRYSNSLSSRSSYSNSILLVTLSVAALIAVVKSSLALSLGLVGALSVVRFRTAVKEPHTLAYILLSVCLGISIGASQYLFAFLIAIFGTIISVLINRNTIERDFSKRSNNFDTLMITSKNKESLLKVLKLISEKVELYRFKTIAFTKNEEYSATINIQINKNEELNNLINFIDNESEIINCNFYDSPS